MARLGNPVVLCVSGAADNRQCSDFRRRRGVALATVAPPVGKHENRDDGRYYHSRRDSYSPNCQQDPQTTSGF